MAIFLYDGLGGGINSIKAKINSLTVRADLTRYGFVINEEKSLKFGSLFKFLPGSALFLILIKDLLRLPSEVSKLKSSIDLLHKDDCKIFKVRGVASVVGQVISLTP